MRISTRKIVVAGMLGAVAIMLGASGFGLIPVPTPAGRATIMHIPAILGGIIEGPVVGALVGLIFGLFSFLYPASAMSADPIVAILPRIFIGIIAYYVFILFKRHRVWGSVAAAIAGTFTNTIGFLGLAVIQGYLNWQAVVVIVLSNTIAEVVIAIVIVVTLVKSLDTYLGLKKRMR